MPDIISRDDGIEREKLPQILQKDLPQFINFLKHEGVNVTLGRVNPNKLHPLQNELNVDKVKALSSKLPEIKDQPLLISKEGMIIDGHHRWAALRESDTPAMVIKINLPLSEAVFKIKEFDKSFSREITEDWMFEPRDYTGILPGPGGGHVKDKDNAMPDYKYTKDAGTKKTNKMRNRYYKKNREAGMNDLLDLGPEDSISNFH